jgi:hypothetical protein
LDDLCWWARSISLGAEEGDQPGEYRAQAIILFDSRSGGAVKTVLQPSAQENPKAKTADPNFFIDSTILKSLDSGSIKSLYD